MAQTKTMAGGGSAMMTYAQIAEATGFSKATVGRLVRTGRLLSVRGGPRSVRVPAAELERFLRQGGIRNRADNA